MTWWQDEIEELRQENAQLREQLNNQLNCCQLITEYLKETQLIEENTSNNLPNDYVELLRFKAWLEQRK
jgi:hypothetical protein